MYWGGLTVNHFVIYYIYISSLKHSKDILSLLVRTKTVNFPQLSQLSPQPMFGENIKPLCDS